MSDPMTNTEVEDVLASIRRLVSDDKRPEAKPAPKAPSDRLVLTPSLRVKDEAIEDGPQDEPSDADDALSTFAENAFSDAGRGGDATHQPEEAESVDEDDGFADEEAQFDDEDDSDENLEHDEHMQDEPDDVLVLAGPDDEVARVATEDRGTTIDAAEQQLPSNEDVDDTAQDEVAEPEALVVPEDWADDVSVQAALSQEQIVVDDTEDVSATATPSTAQTLSEKIAALEMLVGKRTDTFEPDDPGADAYAGTEQAAMEWEDADEVDEALAYGAYVADKPERDEESPAQIFSSDEDVLDEEALRELVSDIVREELQGALGERITRNVRKLVRREIHRALAAQDLE